MFSAVSRLISNIGIGVFLMPLLVALLIGCGGSLTDPPDPPSAETDSASDLTTTGGTLNGHVNPGGENAEVWFEWGQDTEYGEESERTKVGGGKEVFAVNTRIEDAFSPDTSYHFRVAAQNSRGIAYGEDVTFTTLQIQPPTVTTAAPSAISQTGCTFNATVNPNGSPTTGWFEWGTDTNYGTTTAQQTLGNGTAEIAFSQSITGLNLDTIYHYRAVAENEAGTVFGEDRLCATVQDATPPDAPGTPNVFDLGTGDSLLLSWAAANDPESGVNYYIVYRDSVNVGTTSMTSFADTGLTEGVTYAYEVLAVNGVGLEGGRSASVQGRPQKVVVQAPSETIPIAKWLFDAGGGSSVSDDSGMGNHLTVCKYGTTACDTPPDSGFWTIDTPSGTGKAANFLKSSNVHYAKAADADLRGFEELGTASFEVSAWIKRGTTSGFYAIVTKGDGAQTNQPAWGLRVNNKDNLVFQLRDGVDTTADHFVDYFGTQTIPDAWTHARVVVDRRNKTVQLYVNGQLDGLPGTIPDAMGDVSSNGQDLLVGTGYNTAQSPPYTGILDFRLDQVEINLLNSVVGYWSFTEGSGPTAPDGSGLGNDLSLTADSLWCTPGPSGTGFALCPDGVNYASIPDGAQQGLDLGTFSFEVSAWIKRDALGEMDIIASKQDDGSPNEPGFRFFVGDDDKLALALRDGASSLLYTGAVSIPAGYWTHVRAVVDRYNKKVQLYVTGLSDGTTGAIPDTLGSISNSRDFLVGSGYDSGAFGSAYRVSDLEIDDLRVLLNPAISTNPLNLAVVGLWTFDDGCTGGVTGDLSGNGNSLTLVSPATCTGNTLYGPAFRSHASQTALDFSTASFEISAWIKRGATSGIAVVGKGDGAHYDQAAWGLRVNGTNNLVFHLRDGVDTTPGHFVDYFGALTVPDAWTHVRAVVDRVNNTVQLYLNGDPDNVLQALTVSGSLDNANDFRVGSGNYNGAYTGDAFTIDNLQVRKSE
jgi:hypothetical protein